MNPWIDKVLAYNREMAVKKEKAEDLDVVVQGILRLPPGQIQKVLTDEVKAVLKKYGYQED